GSGIAFGLIIFTIFFARSEQMKSIGKVELVPGLFNINEPFLFGLPLVLNPVLALPFFLGPRRGNTIHWRNNVKINRSVNRSRNDYWNKKEW
ncbi:PTS transporter subunit EIIC, partial [Lactococcus lactis]